MSRIRNSKSGHRLIRFGIFLILAALVASMGGCNYTPPPSEDLEIHTWYDLDAVRDNLHGHHILMNDLNSTTLGYEELASPTANGGKGWDPIGFLIGEGGPIFRGAFDGQGHEIHDLYINRPDERYVGLFGDGDGVIGNIGVVNVTVFGGDHVGGLAGGITTVSNSYSIGSVTGNQYVGGLTGDAFSVSNCYSLGSVTGNQYVGGLAGFGNSVSSSYSTGEVTGTEDVGGLVGYAGENVISSHSTGSVTGNSAVGGLVGHNDATVSNSYSSASVIGTTGGQDVGGLAGYSAGAVSHCYCAGSATGDVYVGGLVGHSAGIVSDSYYGGNVDGNTAVGGLMGWNEKGTVSNCYSTGSVVGQQIVGGLVALNSATLGSSFWDTETSGQAVSAGGTGKNTTEMKSLPTFSGAGWEIIAVASNETNSSYIWNIVNNVTYPFLSWQTV
jgi:hypothetical protein